MQRFVATAAIGVCLAAAGRAAIDSTESARLAAAARVVREVQTSIPDEYWTNARCVLVFPDLRGGSLLGASDRPAHGVISCRSGQSWSAPGFIQLASSRRLPEARADHVDMVWLVMNEQGVQKFLQDKVTLGADATVANGPLDGQPRRTGETATAIDVVSYTRAKGMQLELAGRVVRPDTDANVDVYGSGSTLRTILAAGEISAPTQAHALLSALKQQSATTTGTEQAARADRGTNVTVQGAQTPAASAAIASDDLRARIVDIEQTIDRMLADTSPAAVGTSGSFGGTTTTSAGSVTVDRARLLQIRQQLDALIAQVNRGR